MAEEQTNPEETPETQEELREEETTQEETVTELSGGGGGGQPERPRWPIGLAITNLSALDNSAYLLRLSKADPDHFFHGESNPFHDESNHDVYSGQSVEVTVTLQGYPVLPGEDPFPVDIEYIAVHEGIRKIPGIFLFKTTESVIFRGDTPNNGGYIQSFPLQTIRFDLQTAYGGSAEIVVRASYKGRHRAEAVFILQA